MFQVKISGSNGHETRIDLSGTIDEKAGFTHWGVVPSSAIVRVDCREIEGINEAGVRSWLGFFGGLRARRLRIEFENVPLPVLELLATFPHLMEEDEVLSAWI